ncbi:MAG: EAL domain-containing protein [Leptospirillum sp.]
MKKSPGKEKSRQVGSFLLDRILEDCRGFLNAESEGWSVFSGICLRLLDVPGVSLAWAGARHERGLWALFSVEGDVRRLEQFVPRENPAEIAWEGQKAVVDPECAVCSPVFLRGRIHAMFAVCFDQREIPSEMAVFMESLAREVEGFFSRLDRQKRFQVVENLYGSLVSVSEVVLRSREPGEMMEEVCQTLVRGDLFHAAWIGKPVLAGQFSDLARAGAGSDRITGSELSVSKGNGPSFLQRCWESGEMDVIGEAETSLLTGGEETSAPGWKTGVAVPVFRDDILDAILLLLSRKEEKPDADLQDHCRRIGLLLGQRLSEFDIRNKLVSQVAREALRARQDPLTGLPNRLSLEDGLDGAVARARRTGSLMAVCMLDLDNFKTVNDQNGHAAGDLVLRQLAERFRRIRREDELLARMGGDEFVLVLEGLKKAEDLIPVFERLRGIVLTPFNLGEGKMANLDLSAGVALYPLDGEEPDLLLRRADNALYTSKVRKHDRNLFWRRWEQREAVGESAPAYGMDPYAEEAVRFLKRTASFRISATEDFVREFYEKILLIPPVREILDRLTLEEMQHLRNKQAEHLHQVLSAGISRGTVFANGQVMGQVHALVGVDKSQVDESYRLFQSIFQEKVFRSPLRQEEKVGLMSIFLSRLKDDAEGQYQGLETTTSAYQALLARPLPETEAVLTEVLELELGNIWHLPGIISAILLRPDREGVFIPVLSRLVPDKYQAFLSRGGGPPVLNSALPEGGGLVPLAWLNGQIVTSSSASSDPRLLPWREVYREMGIRSSSAIPIFDVQGKVAYVLHLSGAFPGQFESRWMRLFCEGLGRRITGLVSRMGSHPVLPETITRHWRDRLFSGGLRMVYQPVVDLMGGPPTKVEALARLELEDGRTILPGKFIGVLGEQELDRLFWQGLDQSLTEIRRWESRGLMLGVSVNVPPFVVLQADFLPRIRETFRRENLAPNRLYLEILESLQMEMDRSFVDRLSELSRMGIHIVMDDLGSGYSSLDRLSRLPFEAVKVDQSLIRNARTDPYRTVSFVGMLVQLGRDLDMNVIVEGLEFPEQVEVASFLGAHYGQGFFLSTPMPAEDVVGWFGHFSRFSPILVPQTALGALALHWRITHASSMMEMSRYQVPIEDCPNTLFLENRGLSGRQAGKLHRKIHELKGRGAGFYTEVRAAESEFASELVRLILRESKKST